jgi:hypothetical protein
MDCCLRFRWTDDYGLYRCLSSSRTRRHAKLDDHPRHYRLCVAFRSSRCHIALSHQVDRPCADHEVATSCGKYSYGIYVYHLFILLSIRALGNHFGLWDRLNFPERIAGLMSEMIAVFLIAKISYDLFESRFLLLKRYFNPNEGPSLSRSRCST